jgi:DNA gyrase subunit A
VSQRVTLSGLPVAKLPVEFAELSSCRATKGHITQHLLIATEDGYGKLIAVDEIRQTKRGPAGVTVAPAAIAGAIVLDPDDEEILIATRKGKIIALSISDIPVKGRRARGIRLVQLQQGDAVARVAVVPQIKESEHIAR